MAQPQFGPLVVERFLEQLWLLGIPPSLSLGKGDDPDEDDPNLGCISPPLTSQQLFVGTHGADADLLVDHVNASEAGCVWREIKKDGGGGLVQKQRGGPQNMGGGGVVSGKLPPSGSPVKADLVQALLAGLVHRVEPGAGVLLLPTVCKEKRQLVSDGGLGNPWRKA